MLKFERDMLFLGYKFFQMKQVCSDLFPIKILCTQIPHTDTLNGSLQAIIAGFVLSAQAIFQKVPIWGIQES